MSHNEIDGKMFIFYKIVNRVDESNIYVGCTVNFRRRMQYHARCVKINDNGLPLYQHIREVGGWGKFQPVEIERRICKTIIEARTFERELIEQIEPKMNRHMPSRTKKQYYNEHKDKWQQWGRERREKFQEQMQQYDKAYYEKHKSKIIARVKARQAEQKDEIQQYKKAYYQKQKQRLMTKYTCECGKTIAIGGKSQHEKTKFHLEFDKRN